ncbi:hypothetical protein ACHAXR_001204, partial [Thalassiosira sp. AJA248-18]
MERLFTLWQPLIAIIAYPGDLNRAQRLQLLSLRPAGYQRLDLSIQHSVTGGVTQAKWRFVHLSRMEGVSLTEDAIMMAPQYSQAMQTALDDTIGGDAKAVEFETLVEGEPFSKLALARVTLDKGKKMKLLFDSQGLAPDVGHMPVAERYFWVQANSCMSPKKPIRRQIRYHELLGLWDYEGKQESVNWSHHQRRLVLARRLQSPPAKMLRSLCFASCELMLPEEALEGPEEVSLLVGFSKDIPYSPLEYKVEARVLAAQSDYAEVDLSQWATPGETPEVANARAVLRRVAARWWSYYQEKTAREWLAQREATRDEIEGVEDCIKRIRAVSYWSWHQGSRLFFWKFPSEWLADARDGVPFWHLSPPPKGFMKNHPAASREAEIVTRKKIFKLKYRGYLEAGYVSLV